jgi:hypothetical protein
MKPVRYVATLGLAGAFVFIAVVGPGSGTRALALQPAPGQPPLQQPYTSDMMTWHQQMMTEMRAADAKLDELVAAMNASTGEAKATATAQVVTELVRQRRILHDHMYSMGHMMMGMMGMRGPGVMMYHHHYHR